jgi:hypothetical protein
MRCTFVRGKQGIGPNYVIKIRNWGQDHHDHHNNYVIMGETSPPSGNTPYGTKFGTAMANRVLVWANRVGKQGCFRPLGLGKQGQQTGVFLADTYTSQIYTHTYMHPQTVLTERGCWLVILAVARVE